MRVCRQRKEICGEINTNKKDVIRFFKYNCFILKIVSGLRSSDTFFLTSNSSFFEEDWLSFEEDRLFFEEDSLFFEEDWLFFWTRLIVFRRRSIVFPLQKISFTLLWNMLLAIEEETWKMWEKMLLSSPLIFFSKNLCDFSLGL